MGLGRCNRGFIRTRHAAGEPATSSSVGVSLTQDFKDGLDQYLEIEPKTPVVDVPKVKLHTLRDVLNRWHGSSRAVALRPTRDSWLDVMSIGIIAYDVLEIVIVSQGVGSRPNQ